MNCSQSTFCQTRTYRFYHKQGTERGEVFPSFKILLLFVLRMSRRMFPGGDCGTRVCPTVLPTSSASQGEMEDSHHSSGRGAQRNICYVISCRKISLLDDWSIIPPAQVYTSGCLTDREWAGPLSSDTEYCYCQEDKCNGQLQVGFLCSNN